jgi:predicted nucleotidyltransferase
MPRRMPRVSAINCSCASDLFAREQAWMLYNQNRGFYMPLQIKKLLRALKKGLARIYGSQLKAVYLFGSYARGEAHRPDSDIDLMIVLNGEFNNWEVEKRSSELVASLCLENEVVISRIFVSDTEYAHSKMPLLINVRQEGIAV